MASSIWFAADGETASQSATAALVQWGFRVVRSFDLRSAMHHQGECQCPHHGTDRCTCQYVVLLAYGVAGAPLVVTAHSCDCDTELQIVEDANAPTDQALSHQALAALAEAALGLQAGKAEAEVDVC